MSRQGLSQASEDPQSEKKVWNESRAIEYALCVLANRGWKFSGYFFTGSEIVLLGRSPEGETELAARISDPYNHPGFEFYVNERGEYRPPAGG